MDLNFQYKLNVSRHIYYTYKSSILSNQLGSSDKLQYVCEGETTQ